MNYAKNFVFQYVWAILSRFLTRKVTMLDYGKDPVAMVNQWAKNSYRQMFVGLVFGNDSIKLLIGDSNLGFDSSPKLMIHFGKMGVSVNIGMPGARFDHIVQMLKTEYGKKIIALVDHFRIPIFVNCGGNHVLQGSMGNMESSIQEFLSMFPSDQFFAAEDMPDINWQKLGPSYGGVKALQADVTKANDLLKKYFPRIILYGSILQELDEKDPLHAPGLQFELGTGVLGDQLVHYSAEFNARVRNPFIAKAMNAWLKVVA